jgi:hypothetical protein
MTFRDAFVADALQRAAARRREDFEGDILQAVRTSDTKLIVANSGNPRGLPTQQLFDIGRDLGELHAAEQPDVVEVMRAQLGRSFMEARARAGATQQGAADAVTRERLRALGSAD